VDAADLGDSINLSGDWAFQPGDDSRWSRPDFDDSHWRIISTEQSWQDQGVSRPRDFFWYRLHVRLPLQHAPLSLLFSYSAFPYEVYVNGQLVGHYGRLPPDERVDGPLWSAFSKFLPRPRAVTSPLLSDSCVGGDGNRVYLGRNCWGARLGAGALRSINDEYRAWQSERRYEWLPDYSVGFLSILFAAGLLLLYRTQRSRASTSG
jgi:hypothetical protein